MNKLKIAIIGHLKYPLVEPFMGGIESFTHNIAKLLIDRGHEVVVFSAKGTDEKINPYIMCDPAENINEDIIYKEIMDILQDSDFDIVHNNSINPIPNILNSKIPMPMVTTLHLQPFFDDLQYSLSNADNRNNTIITVSNYMQQKWGSIIKNQVIYNGVNLEKFTSLVQEKKENYAIWFGRITPIKGTIYAIKAAKKAGISLKIAGAIYDQEYFTNEISPHINISWLKKIICKNNIEYLGALRQPELRNIIAKARVSLCTPSDWWDEPYGLVAAEALACGTPVATFARGALPEILDEKSGVLAQPNNIDSLSEALLKAMTLKTEDCRKRAEEIADINVMVDKYEELYYKLAKTKIKKRHRLYTVGSA